MTTNQADQVFGGAAARVALTWRNAGDAPLDFAVSARLFQASSATAIPLGETPWKRFKVMPGQTLLESAPVTLPVVKGETRFVIQWLAGSNNVLGTTEVLAYPTNLLSELKTLAGEDPVGVLDPGNELKPLLKALAVEFADLEAAGVEDYRGRLLIVGPFRSQAQMPASLPKQLQALAGNGAGVVWIQPPPDGKGRGPERLKPSFYTVPEGKGAVVVVQADQVANLAETPQAQLNLIQLARLALHPEPLPLPHLTPPQYTHIAL